MQKKVPNLSVLAKKDLFSPKIKSKTEVNALLENENYLVISKSENDDKDNDDSKDNEPKLTMRCEID